MWTIIAMHATNESDIRLTLIAIQHGYGRMGKGIIDNGQITWISEYYDGYTELHNNQNKILSGLNWTGDITDNYCWDLGVPIYGWGFVVKLTSISSFSNISCEVFIEDDWKLLIYDNIKTVFSTQNIIFTGVESYIQSGIMEYGKQYLCRIKGTWI